MRKSSLLSSFGTEIRQDGPQHAIVIQLGENDIPREKGAVLPQTIIADLQTFYERLPNTVFFWSSLLERKKKRKATALEKVDLARRRACKAVSQFMESMGGVSASGILISPFGSRLCTKKMVYTFHSGGCTFGWMTFVML